MSWSICARSSEEFPVMQRWFATGEAIAHLRYLEEKKLIHRRETEGVIAFGVNGRARL
ncbi:MAG: hypothetical protein O7G84_19445 [Gammaproteobacteria bacterium]|nr:hypothetical protein [Gammaproteobacteria bacterium]